MILTADQLEALTARGRRDAQRRELDYMGIPYRVRRDGSLVVLTADVPVLGTIEPKLRTTEPELQP